LERWVAPIEEVGKRRDWIWLLSQSPMVIRTANHDVGKWRIRIQIDGGRDEGFNPGDQSLLKATPLSTPARQAILTVSQSLEPPTSAGPSLSLDLPSAPRLARPPSEKEMEPSCPTRKDHRSIRRISHPLRPQVHWYHDRVPAPSNRCHPPFQSVPPTDWEGRVEGVASIRETAGDGRAPSNRCHPPFQSVPPTFPIGATHRLGRPGWGCG
jgi:hypothetical protein